MIKTLNHWSVILPLALLGVLAATIAVLGFNIDKHEKRKIADITTNSAEHLADRIHSHVEVRLDSLEQLRETWRAGEEKSPRRFGLLARSHQKHIGGLLAINWIDPDGVIRWVVPDAPNEAARDRDVSAHPVAGPVLAAAERSGRLCVSPPVDLFQGGRGIVAYLPVSDRGPGEGFINGVFRIQPLVEECLSTATVADYTVSISDDGSPVHGLDDEDSTTAPFACTRSFSVGSREWTLTLTPRRSLVTSMTTPVDEALAGIGLGLVACLFGLQWWLLRSRRLLQEREARLGSIAEHIPGVVYSYEVIPNQPRKLVHLGPGFDEIVGPETAAAIEARFESLFDLIHADDREPLRDGAERAVARNEILDIELRLRHDDGHHRWVRSMCRPIAKKSGGSIWHIVLVDIEAKKRAEAAVERRIDSERLLLRELDHRVRNNLSSLVSLIELLGARSSDPREFSAALSGRVRTMAHVHGLLSQSRWSGASLSTLFEEIIPGHAHSRLEFGGPPVTVGAGKANALGMLIHELATNSAKHGALRTPGGRISITWEPVVGEESDRILLTWRETGGPPPKTSPAPGVGLSLIEGLVRSDLQGQATLRFPATGAWHEFDLCVVEAPTIQVGGHSGNQPVATSPAGSFLRR